MPAVPRLKPQAFFTPDEWAGLSARSSWKGLLLVAHCWGVILLAGAAAVVWPVLIPLAIMIIGTRQLGLAILMHEAAHAGLHPNLKLNDWVGHWLCAVPVGASLPAYRTYHLAHHKYAQQAEDPDLPLSAAFPTTRASLRRKIVRDLTGQTFFKQRIAPFFGRGAADEDMPEGARVTAKSALPFLAVNAALLVALSLAGVWWAYLVLWLLPMATWFPLVTRLRNIAEHACVENSAIDPLRQARTTHASWWERVFIAPYWVNFHA
ncbi:fatty acid desaturase family protein, partial [Brevundimonas sp.]|uniref:fatty acid desaturase family protein n=1 Tax=Brevundimonas sp. TaxID=1871086 RepID=UPI002600BA34